MQGINRRDTMSDDKYTGARSHNAAAFAGDPCSMAAIREDDAVKKMIAEIKMESIQGGGNSVWMMRVSGIMKDLLPAMNTVLLAKGLQPIRALKYYNGEEDPITRIDDKVQGGRIVNLDAVMQALDAPAGTTYFAPAIKPKPL